MASQTAAEAAVGSGAHVIVLDRDLEKLRRVVMSAVGYSTDRGDEVEVVEIPFDTSAVERERAALEREERDATFARRSMMGGAALALLLVIALAVALGRRRRRAVERLMGQVGFSSRELDMTATKQAMEEAQQEEMLELEGKRKEELRQKVVGMAYQKPGEMAQLLRAWMLKKKASAT